MLAGIGLWLALSWKFSAQIDSRDSIIAAKDSVIAARDATIKFQDALIAEYKNKLQIPTETGEGNIETSYPITHHQRRRFAAIDVLIAPS